jgi:uncharacterized protein YllA (UPF0747 family)
MFPTAIAVGGPSEVGYLSQLGPVYEAFDVVMPVIAPRASLTLLEPRIAKVLDKFGLTIESFLQAPPSPSEAVDETLPGGLQARLDAARDQIGAGVETLEAVLKEIDAGLKGFSEKQAGRVAQTVEGMVKKAGQQYRRSQEIGRDQVTKLRSHLLPADGLQERSLSILSIWNLYGPDVLETIFQASHPDRALPHAICQL